MSSDDFLSAIGPVVQALVTVWPPGWFLAVLACGFLGGILLASTRRMTDHLGDLHQLLDCVEFPTPPLEVVALWTRAERHEVHTYCLAMLAVMFDPDTAAMPPPRPACLDAWRTLSYWQEADLPAPRCPFMLDARSRCCLHHGHLGPHEDVDTILDRHA